MTRAEVSDVQQDDEGVDVQTTDGTVYRAHYVVGPLTEAADVLDWAAHDQRFHSARDHVHVTRLRGHGPAHPRQCRLAASVISDGSSGGVARVATSAIGIQVQAATSAGWWFSSVVSARQR